MPYSQAVMGHRQFPSSMTLVIRGETEGFPSTNDVSGAISGLNPGTPVGEVRSMGGVIAESMSTSRSTTWLFGAFGALALVLGATGIYRLISYSVVERRHEVGIRLPGKPAYRR